MVLIASAAPRSLPQPPQHPLPVPRLRLLTLNCQRAHKAEALERYFGRLLSEREHDFILLQEADPKVHAILERLSPRRHGYRLIDHYNPATEERTQVCVLAKDRYALERSEFVPFNPFLKKRTAEVGMMIARFTMPQDGGWPAQAIVASAHLHAGEHVIARRHELRAMKQELLGRAAPLRIVGGDLNITLPGELRFARDSMQPEFAHASEYGTHSHDTAHLERTRLSNTALVVAGKAGLRWRSRIDHIFVSSSLPLRFEARVHDVLVSDHRPVDVTVIKDG